MVRNIIIGVVAVLLLSIGIVVGLFISTNKSKSSLEDDSATVGITRPQEATSGDLDDSALIFPELEAKDIVDEDVSAVGFNELEFIDIADLIIRCVDEENTATFEALLADNVDQSTRDFITYVLGGTTHSKTSAVAQWLEDDGTTLTLVVSSYAKWEGGEKYATYYFHLIQEKGKIRISAIEGD